MKKILDGIIVVEGKTDVAFLSSFIDAEFVITNGSDIPETTINYLKNTNKKIYVLTDPDFPGKRIRDVLDQNIPNLNHCFISKENSIKHGKVGVAEGEINEILHAIENSFVQKKENAGTLTMDDLFELGLTGSQTSAEKRKIVAEKLNLGFCNAKTFLKRLNANNITKEDIAKIC